ncbi:hypothetical protein KHS38_15465 [Mucilaginibacter sp. Bleaf8]|uniref:hypothetical protein n=1 Tax=Mucilaginibacter sp. Bleaf8 TaxID=2834430 RepID=UPI001BD1B9FE|nr:hypothetical protein [Mucilaginibacter sp. Bleaf8]MBS7565805.1 hypothetical protein [Mucilaginibacter sp. Bleaf8]
MQPLLQQLKKHRVTFIGLLVYALLWFNTFKMSNQYEAMCKTADTGNRLYFGEAVMYQEVFVFFPSVGLIILLLGFVLFRKEDKLFYLSVCILVALPVIGFINRL